jgi:hypothetical protein
MSPTSSLSNLGTLKEMDDSPLAIVEIKRESKSKEEDI